jgi:hypothetical protein
MSKRSDPAAFARPTGASDSTAATDSRAPVAEFDPVPVRPRHDGWSAEKQTESSRRSQNADASIMPASAWG